MGFPSLSHPWPVIVVHDGRRGVGKPNPLSRKPALPYAATGHSWRKSAPPSILASQPVPCSLAHDESSNASMFEARNSNPIGATGIYPFQRHHSRNMSAIRSLVFCTDCGNLLDGSSGDEKAILTCEVCGRENKGTSRQLGSRLHDNTNLGSTSPVRYLIDCSHHEIKAHSIPFIAPLEAIGCADADSRGCPDRSYN